MELHERIATGARPATHAGHDPFSELKTRVHLALISEVGPSLYAVGADPHVVRQRVETSLREKLAAEQGLSRDDRDRLLAELADDVLGYGPLERLLMDGPGREVMVNGPHAIWVERNGRLYETSQQFTDDSHLRRIINKIVSQVGRRID